MSEVYKIAVRLTMESNAAGVLSALSHHLTGVHTDVKKLEGGLNRLHLALGGAVAIAAGAAFLGILKSTADHAKELNKQLANTATLSGNALTSIGMQQQALQVARATTQRVKGVALDKSVELYNETYSIHGADNAARVNAPLAMYAKSAGAATGNYDKAFESVRELVKSGEMTGKIMDEKTHLVDEKKLMTYLDMASKVSAATGDRINAKTFFQIASQGSSAIKNMSDDGMMGMLVAAQQMGGFKVGTASMSLFSQFAGGKMTMPVADELEKLGLVGKHAKGSGAGVDWGDGEGLKTDFIQKLLKSPLDAIPQLRQAMTSHGIEGEDQNKEMFKIFGRQTTQRLMTDFMTNMESMIAERARMGGAQGLEAQNKTRDDQDYDTNLHNVQTAWHNLMAEIGLPITMQAIGVMQKLGPALQSMAAYVATVDPEKIQAIAKGIAIAGAALIGGGAVALLAALGPAGWLVAGIGALAGVFAAANPKQFSAYVQGLKDVVTGLATLDFKRVGTGMVEEFKATIGQIPGLVAPAIHSAMDAIGAAFKAAVAALVGGVTSAIAGIGKAITGIGGPATTPSGRMGNAPGAGGGRFHPTSFDGAVQSGVPSKGAVTAMNHVHVHVDGKEVASVVTKHQVAMAEYPNAIGGHDSYGSHLTAGATAMPS